MAQFGVSASLSNGYMQRNSSVNDEDLVCEGDNNNDDDGELWITPKLSRRHTIDSKIDTSTTHFPSVSDKKSETTTTTTTTTSSSNNSGIYQQHKHRHHSTSRRRHSARTRNSTSNAPYPQHNKTQLLLWYLPRVLFLFAVGWMWSTGLQFIHAKETPLDWNDGGSNSNAVTQIKPHTAHGTFAVTQRVPSSYAGLPVTALYASGKDGDGVPASVFAHGGIQATAADGGNSWPNINSIEDADLDDDDDDYTGFGKDRRHRDLNRDLISRVLQHSTWTDGLSGLLTILVGIMYPYLDWKWQSYPDHKVDWNSVLKCVGGFLGINYAALKLPFETVYQSSVIMFIISFGLWSVCDSTLHGSLLSISLSLTATWLLCFQAIGNYNNAFAKDDYLQMFSYLPSLLFTYCVMMGTVGRWLCTHPMLQRSGRRP